MNGVDSLTGHGAQFSPIMSWSSIRWYGGSHEKRHSHHWSSLHSRGWLAWFKQSYPNISRSIPNVSYNWHPSSVQGVDQPLKLHETSSWSSPRNTVETYFPGNLQRINTKRSWAGGRWCCRFAYCWHGSLMLHSGFNDELWPIILNHGWSWLVDGYKCLMHGQSMVSVCMALQLIVLYDRLIG